MERSLPTGITVGEVAGIISGATSIVAQTLPLLITLILIAFIADRNLNAATWSTAARTLQSTLWPSIMRSDSSRTTLVSRPVCIASKALTGLVLLLLLVHIITPLPLSERVQPETTASPAKFVYAPDRTFFGQGTASRPAQPLRRMCGTQTYTDCTPPQSLFDKLSSGSLGSLIAGPADVQFRNFYYYINQSSGNNEEIPVGLTRPMQYLLLNPGYTMVEGLIVDPSNGGVGLRNHTVPSGLDLGATWQEDILWMQPETVCTNNNFSLHFPFGNSLINQLLPGVNLSVSGEDNLNRFIQDDGAFATRNWTIPSPRWDIYGTDSLWNVTGPVPDLAQRSFLAAWWDNLWVAGALNISNSSSLAVGDEYNSEVFNFTSYESPFAISVSDVSGAIFDKAWPYDVWEFLNANLNRFVPGLSDLVPGVQASYTFADNFLAYGRRCSGFDDYDQPEALKPYIRCGNLYGVSVPEDSSIKNFQLGSRVQQPSYTCASSIKAMIKTVEFTYNGTATLENVNITSITDKTYAHPADEPLWGVENVSSTQNLNVSDIFLLWGLVNDTYANDSDIATIRAKALYLPTAYFGIDMNSFRDNLAVASVFTSAWNSVYEEVAWISGASVGGLPSYSGDIQYSLYLKWRELSSSQEGAAQILNLIWTDIVASAIVGTTTGLGSDMAVSQDGSNVGGKRMVYKHHSVVGYDNVLFAIPAIITLCIWITTFAAAVILLVTRKVNCGMILHYMNQTSVGRAVLDAESPDASLARSSSARWVEDAGNKPISIRPYHEV